MTEITVTKRDGSTKTVNSPYTDQEAIERLWKHTGYDFGSYRDSVVIDFKGELRSQFARDLANKAAHRDLSQKQLAWVHILVVEFESKALDRKPTESLADIRGCMVAEGVKKLTLETAHGEPVKLQLAGPRSQRFGVIHITDGGPFGQNTYYGHITVEGGLMPAQAMTDEVLAALRAFNEEVA
jgi:hypothetical protein